MRTVKGAAGRYDLPVTADRPNRDRAADALAAYLRGEIDNWAFDDELDRVVRKDDQSLRRLLYWLWLCYDDIERHHARGTPERWEFLRRALAFLRTDFGLAYDKPTEEQWNFVPFESLDQWLRHEHLLGVENLPAYDPMRHAPRRRSWFNSGELRWRRVAAAVAAFFLIAYLWLLCVA